MHDDTQVGRVISMGKALRNGQFPVRWVSDLGYGYGYPIFNFYGPLPYYVGGTLYALGISGILATKIMFFIGIVGSGLAIYFLLSRFVGTGGALLGALLYLYAPYHAVQIYVRGAVGEFWILVFLPLILLGLFAQQAKLTRKKGILIGAIGLAGAILSHTLLGYATVFFLGFFQLCYIVITYFRKRIHLSLISYHLSLLFLGLALSAFFWLPAVFEMGYTAVAGQIGPTANFDDHFVCLSQLWNSPWGFGGSAPGCVDGLSFKLGKLSIAFAAISIVLWYLKRKKGYAPGGLFWSSFLLSIGSIYIMTSLSYWFWEIIPGFSYIQYPWRFLAFSSLGLSIIGAYFVTFIERSMYQWLILIIAIFAIVAINVKLFVPQYVYEKNSKDFENNAELRWRVSRISDEYLPTDFVRPKDPSDVAGAVIPNREGRMVDTEIDTEVYTKAFITLSKEEDVIISRAHFPGWRYFIEGKQFSPGIVNGLPILHMLNGKRVVEMRFTDTPVRLIGNIVSIAAFIWVIYYISYGKKTIA